MAVPVNQKSRDSSSFLNLIGLGASVSTPTDSMDVQVTKVVGHSQTNICNISLATLVPGMKLDQWTGPMMRLSLPSFR
ncbi:Protein NEOXANTHIN-DEFICIENT 1 [Linum grandiflorum]